MSKFTSYTQSSAQNLCSVHPTTTQASATDSTAYQADPKVSATGSIAYQSDLQAAQEPEPIDAPYAGSLQVSVVSTLGLIPVVGATVEISYTGDPDSPIVTLTTDDSGQTPTIELPTPPLELSLDSSAEEQPYSEFNIKVTAEGYEPVLVSGSEMFADQFSLQPIRMNPIDTTEEEKKIVIIPAHTLFGEYPPKIPEDEIKPMPETG